MNEECCLFAFFVFCKLAVGDGHSVPLVSAARLFFSFPSRGKHTETFWTGGDTSEKRTHRWWCTVTEKGRPIRFFSLSVIQVSVAVRSCRCPNWIKSRWSQSGRWKVTSLLSTRDKTTVVCCCLGHIPPPVTSSRQWQPPASWELFWRELLKVVLWGFLQR